MPNVALNQIKVSNTEQTGLDEHLSTHYWRSELTRRSGKFSSLTKMAEALATLDADFAGTRGYFQVVSAHRGRASLSVTSKIVRLIDRLFPELTSGYKSKDRLARQGLSRKRH